MKKRLTRLLALVLSLTMVFDTTLVTALAAEEPQVPLPETITAPEELQGGDFFFFTESDYAIGEKSNEKLYIPIGRTGDLSQEAQVTLKLVDMTSHFGVNYTAEILGEDVEPFARYGHVSMVDAMVDSADNMEDFYEYSDDELAQIIYDQGGADITVGDEVVGRVTTEPAEDAAAEPAEKSEEEAKEEAEEEAEEASAPTLTKVNNPLKAGRNQFTGVVSDRPGAPAEEELPAQAQPVKEEPAQEEPEEEPVTLENEFPGTEYTLTFAPDEQVKYLVLTPKYSSKAEGDSVLILSLQNPTAGVQVEENTLMANVVITDEDEPETVTLSMATPAISVSDDVATIEVTRTGGINNMVYATIFTAAGTAETGKDFSGMSAKLYFPFGVTKRTVELPVGHADEELYFHVWLGDPVGCELGQESTRVTLTAKQEEKNAEAKPQSDETALQSDEVALQSDDVDYSAAYGGNEYLANAFGSAYVMDAAIDLSNATKQNQATVSSTTATLSGVGEDDDITNSIRISIPYALYDGVRVDWEQDYSGFFVGCTSGMAWITANDNFHVTYDNTFHRIDDFFFTVPEGRGYVWIANQTNSGYGRVAKVNSVKYIKRDFTFQLEPAATPEQGGLTFANCTPAEIASYQTAILKNSANPAKKTIQSLDSISLSANSANEFVRLVGLEAKKSNGSWYRFARFSGTSRTATITADADTIYSLWANNAITWKETTDNIAAGEQGRGRNKSFSGTITIRPVFEYIDAKVTVNPGAEGNFNANITNPSATGQITETTTLKNVHMGDRLYLTGTAAKPEDKTPLGYEIVQRDDNGTLVRSGTEEYVQAADGVKFDKLLVNQKTTTLTPVFTDRNNSVQVAIPMEIVSQLKSLTDASGNPVNLYGGTLDSNGNKVYTLSGNIKSLDQIVALKAEPKNANHVLLWQETGSTTQYSGNTFYYQAKATAEKNVLTLTVDTDGGRYYSLSGTAIAQVMNLATGRSTGVESAENAYITADGIYTGSASDGTFTMNPVYGKAGTRVRYLTEFNGATGVHEATLTGTATETEKLWYAENNALQSKDVTAVQVSLGNVELPAFSNRSAHVVSVAVYQDNHLVSGGETISLSGAPTKIVITTKDAEAYTDYSGKVVPAEQVTGIGLVFVDPYTGEPHGQDLEYTECVEGPAPSNSMGDPKIYYQRGTDGYTTWTLPFAQGDFVPGQEKFTYGDILYVALQTDKQIGSHFETEIDEDTGDSSSQEVKDYMSYNPMSTGYGVIASDDIEYKEMSLPDVTSMLSAANFTGGASAGKEGTTEASYGEFPFLGAIELGLKTFFVLRDLYKNVNDDTDLDVMLDDMEEAMDEREDESIDLEGVGELTDVPGTSLMYVDESEPQAELQADSLFKRLYNKTSGKGAKIRIDVVMRVKELPHGGARMMIGASATTGMDIGEQSNNWTGAASRWKNARTVQTLLGGSYFNLRKYGSTGVKSNNKTFTGASLTFSLMIGVALDWTNINITKKDADGNVTSSKDNIYLTGVGMFVGGAICFNATLSGSLGPVPCYCGLKVYGSVTTFFMDSGDLKENLKYAADSADATGRRQSLVLDNGWTWDMDFYASIYAGGYVGLGFYGAMGIRADVGVQLDFAKSPKTTAFFEGVGDDYGVNLLLKLSGTLDFWIVSIPLGEYSVPLDEWGFYKYFNEVKKANRLIKYLDDNFTEPWFNGKKGDHPQDSPYYEKVLAQRDALHDLVYSYKATPEQIKRSTDDLRWLAYEYGFISGWQNWCASTPATVSAGGVNLMSEDPDYFIRQPVDSEWVANDVQLFSTYGDGQESIIQKNAYAQPEAQLIDIGNGKMLMVFLASNADNGTNFQTELQYAVYNSANGRWSAPAAVPGGVKGAMTPSVCDAGDDVIITWVGLGAEDLTNQDLRNTVNPVHLLEQMEVYSIRYNKENGFDGVTEADRLTEDEFYDNSPHAVYDENTGDVIVLYTKTAPDTEYDYENRAVSDQLLDFANPYGVTLDEEGNLVGSKTYSVICYMSYNASTADDGNEQNTHTGWQFDSYYSTELTADDFESEAAFDEYVATWKGQRFLPSSVEGINDPPIADLTVCSGYNGLASYAYTVDMDNDLTTTDDRELILQFYNFKDHKTYVPIRLTYDDLYQNQPQLVRNEENTWLFFIEDAEQDGNNRDLMYLNVSDLLKGTYKEDGTLDSDSLIIKPDGTLNGSGSYKIQPLKVDTAGYSDDGTVAGINSYQVFTDEEDNLYVTWLSPAADVEDDYAAETEREQTTTGVEVYATAKVKESLMVTDTSPDSDGQMPQTQTVSAWSKPVQLTNTGKKNDGVTAAVGPNNDLFLVYNQYEMKYNEQEGGMETSPITLMSNKLTKQGSLEVAEFQFSDLTPQPNDTVTVTAILENAGLTAVQGFTLRFYAKDKNGKETPITINGSGSFTTDEIVPVNSTKAFTFTWKAPNDITKLDGMTIVCKAEEKNASGTYPEIVSTSDPFTVTSEPIVMINSIEQRGDQFYVTYTVGNVGNEATSEETTADITVTGLYSKSRTALKKEYGKDQDIVIRSVNVGSIEPNTKKTFSKFVKLPASLFDVCGFDELKVSLMSDDENNPDRETLFTSNGVEVIQTEPINVQLNGGNRIYLTKGATKTISCTADGNANKWMFDPQKDVVYTSSDPSVVTVSETGVLTAVGTGTATITATVLPYGTSAKTDVTVSSYTPSEPDDDKPTTPASKPADTPENVTTVKAENGSVTVTAANSAGKATTAPSKGDTVTVAAEPEKGYSVAQVIVKDAAGNRILVDIAKDGYTFEMPDGEVSVEVVFQNGNGDFDDVPENSYYNSAVQWAAINGITAGVGANLFKPGQDCTRAQIVTFLWRAAGCPKPESQNNPFSDVQVGAYYSDAVLWAIENGITNGTSDGTFSPNATCNRAQAMAFIYRGEQAKSGGMQGQWMFLNPFADVNLESYYGEAVMWAVSNSVTGGTTATTFSPNANCTRAQIVTFLYRCLSK